MERLLSRCLDSIINQTYKELEIILIDDGSTDSSGNICDAYAQQDYRIQVIHQQNSGVSSARNAGLEIATGDYISFIDPDDWVESNMYETLIQHVQNKDIDILRFNAYRKGEIVNQLPFHGLYSGQQFENEVVLPMIGAEKFGGMFILGVLWLHLYRREIIERNHIRFNQALRRCEDRLFTLTAVLHAQNMLFIDSAPYHYEVNEGSLSNKYDPQRWQQELIYLKELETEYKKCKVETFIKESDKRIGGEYLLRAVTSINNEFFSDNKNGFFDKYNNTKTIINNPYVKKAVQDTPREKSSLKGKITLGLIRYRMPLLLSLFNTVLLYKNKIRGNG